MVSGSDFTFSASSGVDSLIEMSGGGGIFSTSSSDEASAVLLRILLVVLAVFLLLPRGAGSRFGVARLYVTVRVTTLLTLTALGQALRGVIISNILLEDQSAGEKGEYKALWALGSPVLGEGPVVGENIGECLWGILSLLSPDTDLLWPDVALWGVGGTGYAEVGDLKLSPVLFPEKLLPVDGFELEETFESSDSVLFRAVGGGLANTGVKAFRKSV